MNKFSPSFDELYCSPIVNMNCTETMFQDLPFCCTKKVPKNHNQLFHFRHGGGTTFLVLAQPLIYLFSHQTGLIYILCSYQRFGIELEKFIKLKPFCWCKVAKIINRPGVAGAVLQTPPLLIDWFMDSLSDGFWKYLQNSVYQALRICLEWSSEAIYFYSFFYISLGRFMTNSLKKNWINSLLAKSLRSFF